MASYKYTKLTDLSLFSVLLQLKDFITDNMKVPE